MGDMREDFEFLKTLKSKKKQMTWYGSAYHLWKAGIDYTERNGGTIFLIREENLSVDYYPTTGRWRFENRTFFGGPESFVKWFKKTIPR